MKWYNFELLGEGPKGAQAENANMTAAVMEEANETIEMNGEQVGTNITGPDGIASFTWEALLPGPFNWTAEATLTGYVERTSEASSFILAFQVEEEEIEEENGPDEGNETEEIEDEGIGSTWVYVVIGGMVIVTLLGAVYLIKFKKARPPK